MGLKNGTSGSADWYFGLSSRPLIIILLSTPINSWELGMFVEPPCGRTGRTRTRQAGCEYYEQVAVKIITTCNQCHPIPTPSTTGNLGCLRRWTAWGSVLPAVTDKPRFSRPNQRWRILKEQQACIDFLCAVLKKDPFSSGRRLTHHAPEYAVSYSYALYSYALMGPSSSGWSPWKRNLFVFGERCFETRPGNTSAADIYSML